MFYVIKKDNTKVAAYLEHSEQIFFVALNKGEHYYHVSYPGGEDYDLLYVCNNDMVSPQYRNLKKGVEIYPAYHEYDPHKTDELDFAIFDRFQNIEFEDINEYSIIITKLLLQHCHKDVYFQNPLVLQFIEYHPRMHIVERFSETVLADTLRVTKDFKAGIWEKKLQYISSMPLFHSIFYMQSFIKGLSSDIKYVELTISENVGIGGILDYYSNVSSVFQKKGWICYLKGNRRYPNEILRKYFNINTKPNDSDDKNTIYLADVMPVVVLYCYKSLDKVVETDIIREDFLQELKTKATEILKGRKALGVLMRGTDYIISAMKQNRKIRSPEEMLPDILRQIAEGKYASVFLATEDQDILEYMQKELGSKLMFLNQKRYRVSDFKDVYTLRELEKQDPDDTLAEKTMVSYFTSLYILSVCDGFMASDNCHGTTIVESWRD